MAKENGEKKDRAALIILPIFLGAGALWYFLRRKVDVDPELAILYGKVTDAETAAGIKDINVNCNGYTGKTNSAGDYQIINIEPGTYDVMFTDPLGRYQAMVV